MRISDWSSDVCSSDLLRLEIGIADAREDMVEGRGLDHLSQRELEIEGLEIILERDQLLAARRLVDAVHDGRLLRLQRLRRRDIGSDHIILDQLVRVEPFTRGRSEEHTSELQSLMRISYAVFCLKKKNTN